MKRWMAALMFHGVVGGALAVGSTIAVVPVFEPVSLHGTDVDEAISDVGDALQASVISRPMALTGAFPEVLVEAIRSPHLFPTNNPNYKVQEVNLLVLCNIGIRGELEEGTVTVRLEIGEMAIPAEVDLTSRQILKLAIIAIRKTLEEYQKPQTQPLHVVVAVTGAEEAKASLRDLGTKFTLGDVPSSN